jgi:hypothetical protein
MIYVICIYRSLTGNFVCFIKGIHTILNQFSKPNIEIIVCSDINIEYLDETCYKKQQLDALLATYSLISTGQFPTRSLNGSTSAIDNIFIDISHHDRQLIQLENIRMQTQPNETRIIRNFNKHYIYDFKTKLSYEIWHTIFGKNGVNKIFNNFHNTFLRIFYSSFRKKKIQVQKKDSTWMSKGLKISINHKSELYLGSRNSKNPKLKEHYKSYCKLLSKVIKGAKILHYKKRILTLIIKQELLRILLNPKQGKKEGNK